jgi:hypothetical protein
MRVLPQALQIIYEEQRKMNNDKIIRKKKAFQLIKCVFFFPSL